jgi:hypothetical protein
MIFDFASKSVDIGPEAQPDPPKVVPLPCQDETAASSSVLTMAPPAVTFAPLQFLPAELGRSLAFATNDPFQSRDAAFRLDRPPRHLTVG